MGRCRKESDGNLRGISPEQMLSLPSAPFTEIITKTDRIITRFIPPGGTLRHQALILLCSSAFPAERSRTAFLKHTCALASVLIPSPPDFCQDFVSVHAE